MGRAQGGGYSSIHQAEAEAEADEGNGEGTAVGDQVRGPVSDFNLDSKGHGGVCSLSSSEYIWAVRLVGNCGPDAHSTAQHSAARSRRWTGSPWPWLQEKNGQDGWRGPIRWLGGRVSSAAGVAVAAQNAERRTENRRRFEERYDRVTCRRSNSHSQL